MDVRVGLWRRLNAEELMLLNCGVGEDSWESLGLQGDPTSPFWRRSALGFLWKEWCWSWNSSTLAISCEELIHWKRLWCWEGLGAGGEGDDRGWDGWMASLTRWTWIWVNCRSWWWTGRPGVLRFMGSQRVGHDWATELNWTFCLISWRIFQLHLWRVWVFMLYHVSFVISLTYRTFAQAINNRGFSYKRISKEKLYPAVNVTGDRNIVQCCKEQCCIGTWNVRSMNQGKLLSLGSCLI